VASSNSAGAPPLSAELDLEDFALSGIEAQLEALSYQPGYDVLRERIWREGHAAGEKEAHEAAEQKRKELASGPLLRIEALLKNLAEERERFMESNAEELLQLALALARRVVRVECLENPEVLTERLRACLRQLELESSYLIRIHPEQLEAMEALLEVSGMSLFGETPHRVMGDRRVPAGSLILEGNGSRLESICQDELERLEQHLLQLYREGETPDGD